MVLCFLSMPRGNRKGKKEGREDERKAKAGQDEKQGFPPPSSPFRKPSPGLLKRKLHEPVIRQAKQARHAQASST